MFFILSKILAWFINPLLWIAGVMVIAAFKSGIRLKMIYCAILMLYIFSNPFIYTKLMKAWEVDAMPISKLQGSYDYAIILGGFADLSQKPADRVHLTQAVDRMMHPVQLYRLGKVKKILVTGGNTFMDEEVQGSEAEAVAKVLSYFMIPQGDILIENESLNTRQNAINTEHLIKADWKGKTKPRLLLVSSAFHLRRAEACFNKVGLDVTCFATDFRTHPVKWYGVFYLTPSAEVLKNWDYLLHELLGYLMYTVLGYC